MGDATGVRQYAGAAAQSALVAGITSGTTSFSITVSTNWPDGSIGNFVVTADPGTSLEEKILCSGLAGGVLTVVTRGYDGTTAVAHAANSTIYPTLSAIDLAEANWIANFHARTSKTTPVDADELPLADSAASFGLKKLTWANIKATLKTYFDTLYARFNGPTVNTQTVSYVLVASDVGKRVVMNAAGATTITVNTSLFGAGDTLEILNIGAGVCTITAGTATVSTAGTLALVQNAGGKLYFTSAGVSTFIPSAVASASGSMTLLNVGGTTLTGASVTISGIDQSYKKLRIVIRNPLVATNAWQLQMQFNADSTAGHHANESSLTQNAATAFGATQVDISNPTTGMSNSVTQGLIEIDIPDYANTATWKMGYTKALTNNPTTTTDYNWYQAALLYNQVGAITSLLFKSASGNLTSGTVYLYGVN